MILVFNNFAKPLNIFLSQIWVNRNVCSTFFIIINAFDYYVTRQPNINSISSFTDQSEVIKIDFRKNRCTVYNYIYTFSLEVIFFFYISGKNTREL